MNMLARINKGPITAITNPDELAPSEWKALTRERRSYLAVKLPNDCRLLLQFVNDAEEIYRDCGYASVDEYIRKGLELDPEQVRWAIDGLHRMKPDEEIPYERAIELGKQGGARPGAGRPKKGGRLEPKEENQGDNITLNSKRGTSRAYILARLDRDGHAGLAAKVRAKELSANAAAEEAGYRKKLSALDRIFKLLPKLTAIERRKLQAALAARG
jgi:hypothetical protein